MQELLESLKSLKVLTDSSESRRLGAFVERKKGMVPMRKMFYGTICSVLNSTEKITRLTPIIRAELESKHQKQLLPNVLQYVICVARSVAFTIAAYNDGCHCLDLIGKFGWSHEWEGWLTLQSAVDQLDVQLKDSIARLCKSAIHSDGFVRIEEALEAESREDVHFYFDVNARDLQNWHNATMKLRELALTLDRAQRDLVTVVTGVRLA